MTPAPPGAARAVVGRILRSADFQSVLATAPQARSAHFSVHHVAAHPSLAKKPVRLTVLSELSTGGEQSYPLAVDESCQPAVVGCWLGLVVPKRHAKRSVTRNLLKRQMREAMAGQAGRLTPGLWVLRLKAPFDRKLFYSPASDALRYTAHDELQLLLQRASVRR